MLSQLSANQFVVSLEQPIDQKGHYSQSCISNTALMPRLMFLSKSLKQIQRDNKITMQMLGLLSGWCFRSYGVVVAKEWMHRAGSEMSIKQ